MPSLSTAIEDAVTAIGAHRASIIALDPLAPGSQPQRPPTETDADNFNATADALATAVADVHFAGETAYHSAIIAAQQPPLRPRLHETPILAVLMDRWPDEIGAPAWSFLAHPESLQVLAAAEARLSASLALLV